MKNLFLGFVVASTLGVASIASADVSSLAIRFGGGCLADNTGNCIIKVTASGTDLDSEGVQLYHADSSTGTYRRVSSRVKALSSEGFAQFRIANLDGCYKVRTGPNGNDKPDVTSRAKCEN